MPRLDTYDVPRPCRVVQLSRDAFEPAGIIVYMTPPRFSCLLPLAVAVSLTLAISTAWMVSIRAETVSGGDDRGNPTTKALVGAFETRYRSARTLETTFLERYTENGHLVRMEAGAAYFRRPGKMRWEYESPEKNLFLVDGKTAWFYVPSDHTVMRVPAKESTDWRTPLALLAGEMKVSRVCARVELAADEIVETEVHAMLHCLLRGGDSGGSNRRASSESSKSDGQSDTVFFEIVRDTGELARLLVRHSGGVQVEFRFGNWRMDPPVPDSLFRFDVPIGVAIVNGELPAEGSTAQ
jgi:outer membrane lipoprotein carrier protein